MNSTGKAVLIGAASVGGLFLLTNIAKANSLYNRFEVVPSINVHNVGIGGLVLNVDAKIINPSNGQIKVRKPTIKLWSEDKKTLLGMSDVYSEIQTLEKWSDITFSNMRISIPVLSLPSSILSALKNGYIKMVVEVITTVNGLTVEKEEIVELSIPKLW